MSKTADLVESVEPSYIESRSILKGLYHVKCFLAESCYKVSSYRKASEMFFILESLWCCFFCCSKLQLLPDLKTVCLFFTCLTFCSDNIFTFVCVFSVWAAIGDATFFLSLVAEEKNLAALVSSAGGRGCVKVKKIVFKVKKENLPKHE